MGEDILLINSRLLYKKTKGINWKINITHLFIAFKTLMFPNLADSTKKKKKFYFMLSKSPLMWNTAFHISSSWKKMFYNELKSVIFKRYWIASSGKFGRSQRNKVHKEGPFQPWTTCSSRKRPCFFWDAIRVLGEEEHPPGPLIDPRMWDTQTQKKTSLMSAAKHWWHEMHVRGKSHLMIYWSGHSNARDSTSGQHFMPPALPADYAFWLKRVFLEMLVPSLVSQR